MTVHARVAEILDSETVVINKGQEDGVQRDMKFIIYREGDEVTDPETDESMGPVEIPVARIKPVHVMEDMSLMESDETEVKNTGPLAALNFQKTTKKDLPVDSEPDSQGSDDTISVGDRVRSI